MKIYDVEKPFLLSARLELGKQYLDLLFCTLEGCVLRTAMHLSFSSKCHLRNTLVYTYKYTYSNNHTTTNIVISPLFDRQTQSRAPQYKVVTCAESLNEVGTCGESTLCSKLPHRSDALVLMWQEQSAGGPELPAGGGSHISCSLPLPWGPPRHRL